MRDEKNSGRTSSLILHPSSLPISGQPKPPTIEPVGPEQHQQQTQQQLAAPEWSPANGLRSFVDRQVRQGLRQLVRLRELASTGGLRQCRQEIPVGQRV